MKRRPTNCNPTRTTRLTLSVWFIAAIVHVTAKRATAKEPMPPYPPSPRIESVTWDDDSVRQFGPGSDQWPMTWSADGHVYTAWGDGFGWEVNGPKRSIGVTRILGMPPELEGEDLWGDGPGRGFAKPEALIAVGEDLFMFWTRGDSKSDDDDTATAVSHDSGVTWTYGPGRAFPQLPEGFRVRGICQFGKGYQGARDRYVYVYFGFNRHSDLFLARVPREALFDPAKYEWFTRMTPSGDAAWSHRSEDRRPVFHDDNAYIWHISVCHNPGLDRFLLSKPHYCPGDDRSAVLVRDSGVASLGLFDSPYPWGPWTTILYEDNFRDDLVKFNYVIPPKFLSDNGQTFWLAWTGWPEYDNVNFIRGTLTLASPAGE